MGFSSLITDRVSTHQKGSRAGKKIDRFVVHHAASTSHDAVVKMMTSGSRKVSSNYVVSQRITGVVDENDRAWTSSSPTYDGHGVTVEVINDSTKGWTVSPLTFTNLAKLIADVATRHRFAINDTTVVTHQEIYKRTNGKESYATACPGDLQRRKAELITLARLYQSTEHPLPTSEDQMSGNTGFYYTRASDKSIVNLIVNTESGFQHEYTRGVPNTQMPPGYNNAVATAFRTGAFASITEGHATVIKRGLRDILKVDVSGEVVVVTPPETD